MQVYAWMEYQLDLWDYRFCSISLFSNPIQENQRSSTRTISNKHTQNQTEDPTKQDNLELSNVDYVSSNAKSSLFGAMLPVFEPETKATGKPDSGTISSWSYGMEGHAKEMRGKILRTGEKKQRNNYTKSRRHAWMIINLSLFCLFSVLHNLHNVVTAEGQHHCTHAE